MSFRGEPTGLSSPGEGSARAGARTPGVDDEPRRRLRVDEIDTPAVVIDLEVVESNLARWQAYCDEHGIANRPHVKTHKVVELAHRQVELGAVGITCQKLGEAEVMAEAGLSDIFLPYNIVGPSKLERLIRLAKRIRISVSCDNETVARGLSEAARQAGITLAVLVECDTGLGRCGVQTPEAAVELARTIARLPGLEFTGLMTYPTQLPESNQFMESARRRLESAGMPVGVVSGGGTPGMWRAHEAREFTEHRAGTYVYHDRYTVAHGAGTWDHCAMRVLATVVSRPTVHRAIIDAGSKTLSSDLLGLRGYGYLIGYPGCELVRLSEEHGIVETEGPCPLQLGERVEVIPNHACAVSNLHDYVYATRRGVVEAVWRVAARGKVL